MNNSPDGIKVTERFFEAISMLTAQKTIRGLGTFTRAYGLNRWNMVTIRDNKETAWLKPEYLTYLVRDYNVSAEWLLTGRGGMFKK